MTGPMAHARARANPADGKPPVRRGAGVVAVVFLLLGLLGFLPGVTSDFPALRFAGHHSDAMLFGALQVSVLHNLVHLLTGVGGLVLARTATGARAFLVGGGTFYLVLWLYGVVVDRDSGANFLPLNPAGDWLHLGLGLVMLAFGLLSARSHR